MSNGVTILRNLLFLTGRSALLEDVSLSLSLIFKREKEKKKKKKRRENDGWRRFDDVNATVGREEEEDEIRGQSEKRNEACLSSSFLSGFFRDSP